MEAPKLPRAVLPTKTVNDSLTPGMFGDEVGAIVDDVVHYEPDAAEIFPGRANDCSWDEEKLAGFELDGLEGVCVMLGGVVEVVVNHIYISLSLGWTVEFE